MNDPRRKFWAANLPPTTHNSCRVTITHVSSRHINLLSFFCVPIVDISFAARKFPLPHVLECMSVCGKCITWHPFLSVTLAGVRFWHTLILTQANTFDMMNMCKINKLLPHLDSPFPLLCGGWCLLGIMKLL